MAKLPLAARIRCIRPWALLPAAGVALLITGLLVRLWHPPQPLLLWNTTASSPIGLYRIGPAENLRRGAMVVARPPDAARRLGAQRHYIPANVPLVKQVAAVAGDRVCAVGDQLFVNGRPVARRRPRDRLGRPLPQWAGCETIAGSDLFLLMAGHETSFDGRYFGITRRSQIVGRASLLWAR
ncbi:MAG: S26 family signal peptidase [Pseudomonadota bacterium]